MLIPSSCPLKSYAVVSGFSLPLTLSQHVDFIECCKPAIRSFFSPFLTSRFISRWSGELPKAHHSLPPRGRQITPTTLPLKPLTCMAAHLTCWTGNCVCMCVCVCVGTFAERKTLGLSLACHSRASSLCSLVHHVIKSLDEVKHLINSGLSVRVCMCACVCMCVGVGACVCGCMCVGACVCGCVCVEIGRASCRERV